MRKARAPSKRGAKRSPVEGRAGAGRAARPGRAPGKTPRRSPPKRLPAPLRNGATATQSSKKPAHPPEPAAPRKASLAPPQNRGKYVYCIIQSEEPLGFGPLGLGAEPSEVGTVNWRDLAAVVSDTPMGIHDPTRENVLAHQRVNETVMREHTVIPMSFGTVFKTNQDIVELLKTAYDAFKDVLAKMQSKLEFGLKVLWERDQVIKEIENEDDDIRKLKNEILSQKGSTYFARMQYGRMIDAALQQRSEYYVSEIFAGLRDVSVASRSNKPIGDKMIMNAAFLVLRDRERAFDQKIKEIGGKYPKLTFKYTGPWPPYNFVNIRLKLERAQ